MRFVICKFISEPLRIVKSTSKDETVEGLNITIECEIEAEPKYESIKWFFGENLINMSMNHEYASKSKSMRQRKLNLSFLKMTIGLLNSI
jgi:hypothetical protein